MRFGKSQLIFESGIVRFRNSTDYHSSSSTKINTFVQEIIWTVNHGKNTISNYTKLVFTYYILRLILKMINSF